jgi:transcriptional regulator with PAS, ATPase and Fis domain
VPACTGANGPKPRHGPQERELFECVGVRGREPNSRFRGDLYFRLSVVGFALPPLRERRGRIAPLAEQFRAELAARNRPEVTGLSGAALPALEGYDWPGNVRDLLSRIASVHMRFPAASAARCTRRPQSPRP